MAAWQIQFKFKRWENCSKYRDYIQHSYPTLEDALKAFDNLHIFGADLSFFRIVQKDGRKLVSTYEFGV